MRELDDDDDDDDETEAELQISPNGESTHDSPDEELLAVMLELVLVELLLELPALATVELEESSSGGLMVKEELIEASLARTRN